jgi:chemotaxis protein CheX
MSTAQGNPIPADAHEAWAPILELSAREVFSLMLGAELGASDAQADEGLNITSMVGLAGSLCGLLSFRCSSKSAVLMASKMLGMDPGTVHDEMLDAAGEVCNMVAGNFKNKIAGMGDGCQLSVPTVITGDNYSMRALTNDRTIDVRLTFEGSPLVFSINLHN